MEKEYVIGLNRNVDTEQFWKDVETITNLDNIPNRAVEVANARFGSNRLTHYFLTEEEAELIRQDERVYCVEIPADQRDDISIELKAIQPSGSDNNFTKTPDSEPDSYVDATGSFKNWGLIRHKSLENNYGTSFTTNESYTYTLDGEGVDIVIQDSGIQADHPEWEDENGNSRLQQIHWYSASGLQIEGSQGEGFYADYDGHGTHCAGTAAGKTFGFAKNARIYAQKLNGLQGGSDPDPGIPISDSFDLIRLWHASKSGSRPTVVNMSWGYGNTFGAHGLSNINWRGTDYSTGNAQDYGLWTFNQLAPWRIEIRVSSIDVEIQEMIDAGIHVVIAAGNLNYKCEISGGIDYDNYATVNSNNYYYHRGSSPYDDEAIKVGSMSYLSSNATTDQKSDFSNAGPAVDIYAAGHFVVSSLSNTNIHNEGEYYDDTNYKQGVLSGTSMAAPNVAGVVALMCQANPKATPSSIKSSLLAKAGSAFLTGSNDSDYSTDSTMGGDNKVLFNPFSQTPTPGNITGINTLSANLLLS